MNWDWLSASFPWYYILLMFIVGIFLGGFLVKKFGTDWLAMLSWMVGDEELTFIAKIVWDAGLIPPVIKTVMFQNDVEKFTKWVLDRAHSLKPAQAEKISVAAAPMQFRSARATMIK